MSGEEPVLDDAAIKAGEDFLLDFATSKKHRTIAEGVVAKIISSFYELEGFTSKVATMTIELAIGKFTEDTQSHSTSSMPLIEAGYYAEALRGALNAATNAMGMDNSQGFIR